MKKIISILLILLYSTVLFIPLNPVIHYVLHKKYYAEVLCKNKDKPKMHCNGKCHLKKELNEKENNNNNPHIPIPIPQTNKEKQSVILKINSDLCSNYSIIKQNGLIYLLPHFNEIYLEVITPPPIF